MHEYRMKFGEEIFLGEHVLPKVLTFERVISVIGRLAERVGEWIRLLGVEETHR